MIARTADTLRSDLAASVKSALHATGWYARRLRRDDLPGVLVLCYHGVRSPAWRSNETSFPYLHIDGDTFEGHCRVLAETCHPISLDRWRAALERRRSLPDRPVLVTFDDGYRSVYELAWPILKRYEIPATVFVCSEPVRHQRLFWFDAVARARGERAVAEQIARDATGHVRTAAVRADPADPLAPMTIDHVKALADDGAEIGAHTATHALLARTPATVQRTELESCRDRLREWIGGPVRSLAYPWGRPGADYTKETVSIARDLGFDFAFTTRQAFAGWHEPALERSRFLVLSEVAPAELAHRITYAWR